MNAQEEIDLTLAIQLQARFEEELRVSKNEGNILVTFKLIFQNHNINNF